MYTCIVYRQKKKSLNLIYAVYCRISISNVDMNCNRKIRLWAGTRVDRKSIDCQVCKLHARLRTNSCYDKKKKLRFRHSETMREIEKENCLNFKMSFKSQSRSDHINKLFNTIDTRFIYFYLFKPCIDHIEKYYPKEKKQIEKLFIPLYMYYVYGCTFKKYIISPLSHTAGIGHSYHP